MNALAATFAVILCIAPHGELHKKIKELDEKIAKQPRSVELRLQRGEYLRLHKDFLKSLKDFQTVQKLDPKNVAVLLLKGQLFIDMKRHSAAEKELAAFRKLHPKHEEALRLTAQNEAGRGDNLRAIACYQELLRVIPTRMHDDLLACARLMAKTKSVGAAKTVVFLDEQMKLRGSLIVLELETLRYEMAARQFEEAIARIARLSKNSRRQDLWDVRRAEVYQASGDAKRELECWQAAAARLKKLPRHVRRRPNTTAQSKKISEEIKRLTNPDKETAR